MYFYSMISKQLKSISSKKQIFIVLSIIHKQCKFFMVHVALQITILLIKPIKIGKEI